MKLGKSSLQAVIETPVVVWDTTQVDERFTYFARDIRSHIPLQASKVRKKLSRKGLISSDSQSLSRVSMKSKRTCERLHPTSARLQL